MSAVDYLRVEIHMKPLEGFVLGKSRLALARLGMHPDQDTPAWIDVTGDLTTITTRSGGLEHAASGAIEAGYLSFNARNSLNPFMGWNVHPGLPVRVMDTSATPRAVWTGALDDIDVVYTKTAGYNVKINASDAVRDLKATTVRGQPGSPTEIGDPTEGSIIGRMSQLASASSVLTSFGTLQAYWGTPQILPDANWNRFGTPPAGYVVGDIVDFQGRRLVRDTIDPEIESVAVTAGDFGLRNLISVTVGEIYEVSVEVSPFYTKNPDAQPEEHAFALRLSTGETGIPMTVVQNSRSRPARARLVFRATSPVATVQLIRAYEGELKNQPVFYSIVNTRLRRWTATHNMRPIQAVAYESSAFNHLVMATDSVGLPWFVNAAGALATNPNPQVVATLSDEHSADPDHLCFFDIEAGYSTADTVNTIDVDNHGRTVSHEQFDAWIVADEQTTFVRSASIDRYRPRALRLDTQLPRDLLDERLVEIFDDHDTPRETIRSISINALEHPLARSLKPTDLVHIKFRTLEGDYSITGIENLITPKSHTIKLQTTRRLP